MPISEALMTEVAEILKTHPELLKIEIQGHVKPSGDRVHDKELSMRRAQKVRKWLVAIGVAPDRLIPHGYGSEVSLVPNDTEVGRQKNDRTRFKTLEIKRKPVP